ncbi:MAG: alpha-E domain-containing protein [Phycisphaera sp.]|nr:alpha-E domain-containing protein [Phycisphaera sp.]
MLSRVANAIYWMSRYVERAENTARFIDAVRHLVLDLPGESRNEWESLLYASGDEKSFIERYGEEYTRQNVVQFMTFDRDNPNSIASCMRNARENARSIREIISSEMWEQLNRSYLMMNDRLAPQHVADDPAGFFSHFKKACLLFSGATYSTMTHNEAWQFCKLGWTIERADKTSRVLDVKYFMLLPRIDYVNSPYDSLQWAGLLRCISAFEMFRKHYRQIVPRNVAEFLLLSDDFPRSVRFCLMQAELSMNEITGSRFGSFVNGAEQRLGRLRSELDYAEIQEILNYGLHEYLDAFQSKLNAVGKAIHEAFFDTRRQPETTAVE